MADSTFAIRYVQAIDGNNGGTAGLGLTTRDLVFYSAARWRAHAL